MLCSFVACTTMRRCTENCTAYFTTNNCSEEKGTTTKDLDTFSTRTDGFWRTPPAQIWMHEKLVRKWDPAVISHSYDVLFIHFSRNSSEFWSVFVVTVFRVCPQPDGDCDIMEILLCAMFESPSKDRLPFRSYTVIQFWLWLIKVCQWITNGVLWPQ